MTTATRRGILATVTAIVLVALGIGVGAVVGDALGISATPSRQMSPAAPTVPVAAAPVVPPALVVRAPDTVRMSTAIDELDQAEASVARRSGAATLTVTAGSGDAADDSYTLTGSASALRIEAASETGAVRGVYDLAARIRAGRSVAEGLGEKVTSKLPFRMADLGAVGVQPDPAQWRSGTDYSHASGAFEDAYLPRAPYVDATALAKDYADWDTYLRHILADGYNAVAWPGFIEYAEFATAGVYPAGDEHIARAKALREAFSPFWDRAKALGVKVYLRTDMLALTPALHSYLERRFGSDTEDPALWKVYTDALDELYAQEPGLSGVLIRIGEGGSIYQTPGFDYYSAIAVRSVAGVRAMLKGFLAEAEASDHEVIFRSWSVGIGDVGDMHTDPASYEAVLKGIDSPKLIVSTKYTQGDFYSWLPLNATLAVGDQRRIVEFQSRREFEGFGAFPNDLGAEFRWAMQQALAADPHIEGVWAWTQDGGPWRAGPMSLYLKAGFWQLYEANTMLAAAIARDPAVDVGAVTQDWIRRYLSDDPATVTAIADAMALSRDAIRQGLYVQPFAEQSVKAIGLEPPPQMWLFEWDILTGDSATLDVMSAIVGDRRDEAVSEGEAAVRTAEKMRDLVAQTDAATWHSADLRTAFTSTMDYEVDTLRLLSAYRAMFLAQAAWHATLSGDAYAEWQAARNLYEKRAAAHLAAYWGDLDHPAWNLTAAALGVQRADRDLAMSWLARVLLVLALAWSVIGALSARTRLVGRPGAAAARASWIAAIRPWRARESTLGMLSLDRWLLLIVPGALLVATRAVQTSFLGWAQLAAVLGAWVVFVLVVRLLIGRRSPWPVIAAVGGVVVIRCVLTLVALSFTGPGGYWYGFWTSPVLRTLYIAIGFALFVWVFVAAGWALSAQVGARRATGFVLAGVGAGLAVPAAVVGAIGLERALTAWNDQLGLLPWGLARILGITTYLEIPDDTAWWAAALGLLVCVVGVTLALGGRRRSRAL
ncbi:hypothetical protein [Microbacterium sp.]|uniref:hypothetical protein n=1 Tax=Microbacterium sp. TaxID=51671 RepID=UPI001AC43298|nr:hypothetical protein [Microbacterium sp.]MBN9192976.1 hypothetical protein [Microbacterium sp.]